MTNRWLCPVCGERTEIVGRTYKCANGHSFDCAKSGYVNLILSSKSLHGDDREMIKARNRFLEKGYYAPLRSALCETAKELLSDVASPVVLDAGCGECYYTSALSAEIGGEMLGIDLSKDALIIGDKRRAGLELAAASVNSVPLEGGTLDAIISVFAPLAPGEFSRLLRRDGILIHVIPLADHLFGMKKVLYDKPYKNEEEKEAPEGFTLTGSRRVEYTETIKDGDIADLFSMTPYCYRTGRAGKEKLAALSSLETRIAFGINVYKKSEI